MEKPEYPPSLIPKRISEFTPEDDIQYCQYMVQMLDWKTEEMHNRSIVDPEGDSGIFICPQPGELTNRQGYLFYLYQKIAFRDYFATNRHSSLMKSLAGMSEYKELLEELRIIFSGTEE